MSFRALAVHFSAALFLSWAGKVAAQTAAPSATTNQPVAESRYTVAGTESLGSPTPESVSIGTTAPDVNTGVTTTKPGLLPTDVATAAPADDVVSDCPCNITPRFCDIGCCCDVIDCNVTDLSSVFAGCQAEESYAVCVESWLVFRGNVDPALITGNGSLFCVRDKGDVLDQQSPPALPKLPKLQDSYSFSLQGPLSSSLTRRAFYRADDVILTYYSRSSVIDVLRQPSPGGATAMCLDRNPAKFLRSGSLFCSRSVTRQSCLSDPGLSARSYFSDISLLKVSLFGLQVTLIPLSEWPDPLVQDGSCLNVVSQVGGHLFWAFPSLRALATPPPTVAPPPTTGLKSGAPLTGRFSSQVQPLTVQGVSVGGDCSTGPQARTPVLFQQNYMTGCTLRSVSHNCSELRSQLYGILRGVSTPDVVAMNAGGQRDWTRVITQDCAPPTPEETCDSGCLVPLSLSVHVLWAKRGLLSLPYSQILGAGFRFRCQSVTCPLSAPLAVTTQVTFAEATVYRTPAGGRKLPPDLWRRAKEPPLNRGTCSCALLGSIVGLTGFILSMTV
ncbi:tectonic-3-like isoform X1 [Arapaima gigas]